MRALIAPYTFPGLLSAVHIAEHLASGLSTVGIATRLLPLTAGREGSIDAAVSAGFTPHPVTVAGETGLPHYSRIALHEYTVVIDLATICGRATLPGGRRMPLDASSLGLGQAIGHALRHDPDRLVLTLGGSAGVDGGMGMLAALGFTFHDVDGRQLRACGRTLSRIHTVDCSRTVNLEGIEIVVTSDVTSPLLGPTGATAVYGPHTGATDADARLLDAGLDNLVEAFVRSGYPHARDIANAPGAGSAGGIGFATMLLGARMVSGAQYFLDLFDFDGALTDVDLVVTAGVSVDEQAGHGRLFSVLAERARPLPVIAVVERARLPRPHGDSSGFDHIYALCDYTQRGINTDPRLTGESLRRIGRDIGITAITSNTRSLLPTGSLAGSTGI
ncbi:glycerate kinase [Rhodococcus aetherivorans]